MSRPHAFARLILAGTFVLSGAVGQSAPPSGGTVLDVPGRTDATPSIAASGSFVAVAWGATDAGKTDVFAAVSRDGGTTFGPAVQVNATPGEARLGGELPPRVALATGAGRATPEIVIAWTARGDNTAIKVARSADGGRTFAELANLPSSDAPGDRGWPAIALDDRGAIHAVWLDHRGLAANRHAEGGHRRHQLGRRGRQLSRSARRCARPRRCPGC